jgi:glycyl-tRNA synthetase
MELIEKITSLAKKRGFVYPSHELYGGVGAVYDFGPLGVAMKRNLKDLWWKSVVELRDDVVGLESSIIVPPSVLQASGHIDNFSDPMIDCKSCKARFRADFLDVQVPTCTNCGGYLFSAPRNFNLMFKTKIGPMEESANDVYLRPETAQGIFVQFANVQRSSRAKIPFGIAQIGKSFRNEISPGNFIFRLREFEQMELEFFVQPDSSEKWLKYWKEERLKWWIEKLGINPQKIRARLLDTPELAHYSKKGYEIEYEFPWGWAELEGVQDRGDYDLLQHANFLGTPKEKLHSDLSYYDEESKTRYVPHVIEPSMGVERALLAVLCDAYLEDTVDGEKRVLLKLSSTVAPIQIAILPLSKKVSLVELSHKAEKFLRPHFRCAYDETGTIGKRYRRQEEIGTPYAITIDFQSLQDNCVTVRERDSMQQERISLKKLKSYLWEKLNPIELGQSDLDLV